MIDGASDEIAPQTCDVCRRELLWRSRDRAIPLLQLGRWGNRRRRGRPAHCWWGGVSPLYYLASYVCWSLRCLCERVQSHGRRSCVPLSTTLFPEEAQTLCVRACNHRPQQHQHQTAMPSAVPSSPCIRALALTCSSGQTVYLQ